MEGGQPNETGGQPSYEAIFSMGDVPAASSQPKKLEGDQLAEQRLKGLAMHEEVNIKKKSENYAVQLRKDRRQEALKKRKKAGGKAEEPVDPNAVDVGCDPTTLSIADALALQEQRQFPLETFINNVVVKMKFKVDQMPRLVGMIHNNDTLSKLFACIGIRKLLSIEDQPPIQQVIEANLIKMFIDLLTHEIPKFQFEAAWCLTNIASGSTDHVVALIERDVIPQFVKLMESMHPEVVDQAVWGLGNIAGDNIFARDQVIANGCLQKLAAMLPGFPAESALTRNATWTLSNLCRGKPRADIALLRQAIQPLAGALCGNENKDILIDCCWSLNYIVDGSPGLIEDFMMPQLLARLLVLVNSNVMSVQIPIIRILGNLTTGDDRQTQNIIDQGLLPALGATLEHPKRSIRKEVAWVLSNLTAGNTDQLRQCIEAGLIDKLAYVLINDNVTVKMEAVWALSNATAIATPSQMDYMVSKDLIRALSECLKIDEVSIIAISLQGLNNILKCGQTHFMEDGFNKYAIISEANGTVDMLEELQYHKNQNIYKSASQIIEEYFGDEEDDNVMAVIDSAAAQNAPQTADTSMGGNTPAAGNGGGLFDI